MLFVLMEGLRCCVILRCSGVFEFLLRRGVEVVEVLFILAGQETNLSFRKITDFFKIKNCFSKNSFENLWPDTDPRGVGFLKGVPNFFKKNTVKLYLY